MDHDARHCEFARRAVAELSRVRVHCADSIRFLTDWTKAIDVLFLDSLDTGAPRYREHCLAELRAAERRLTKEAVVVFDDTVGSRGRFEGKGALAVPWLLGRGWKILFSGYQTLCVRL